MDGWTCLLTALVAGSTFPDSVDGIKAQGGCRQGVYFSHSLTRNF